MPALIAMVVIIFIATIIGSVEQVLVNQGQGPYTATLQIGSTISGSELHVLFHVYNTGSKPGRPDQCNASLFDSQGYRVGTAGITLHQAIAPKTTVSIPTIAIIDGSRPVTTIAACTALTPQ